MNPARKPSAKPVKCKRRSHRRQGKKPVPPLIYIGDDEDVTDVSKPKAPSDFIRRIWAVKSRQEPHVTTTH